MCCHSGRCVVFIPRRSSDVSTIKLACKDLNQLFFGGCIRVSRSSVRSLVTENNNFNGMLINTGCTFCRQQYWPIVQRIKGLKVLKHMSEFMRTITSDMLCKVPNILEFGRLLPFPTSILSRGFVFLRMFNKTCKVDLQQSPFQPTQLPAVEKF